MAIINVHVLVSKVTFLVCYFSVIVSDYSKMFINRNEGNNADREAGGKLAMASTENGKTSI